jgi:hypothetical protein
MPRGGDATRPATHREPQALVRFVAAEIPGSELKIIDKTAINTLNKTETYDTHLCIGEVETATHFVTRLEA